MPTDSLTPPSSQGQSQRLPYQSTDRLADPFTESTSPPFKRPLTPSTNDNKWRDDTVSAESSPPSAASSSPAQGSKRTASGQVKRLSQIQPASPARPTRPKGHARTPSTESALGNIGQLSEQLKTRLSYAMVKVQNGWETCSIDQVENLASQLGSPMSTSSPFRNSKASLTSPRVSMTNANRRSRDLSQITSQLYPMSPPEPPKSSSRRSLMQPPALGPLSPTSHSSGFRPSLAPAVSFDRQRRRMSDALSDITHSEAQPSNSSSYGRHAYSRAKTPTPQEQDAVDTLLFMSSPANSQFPQHTSSIAQPSPLRPDLPSWAHSNSRLGDHHRPWLARTISGGSSGDDSLGGATTTSGASQTTSYERQAKRRSFGPLKSTRDVDKLLDEMNDGSSEDEAAAAAETLRGTHHGMASSARPPPASVGHVDVRV